MEHKIVKDNGLVLRIAEEKDCEVILELIKELAVYEKMLDKVTGTIETLRKSLFEKRAAEVILAEYEGKVIGYALYFYNFSTFLGKAGIYLEDIYVKPECRGKGFGKTLLSQIATVAQDNDCDRVEWACLNWNKPSIDFYESIGAVHQDEWRGYRLTTKAIEELATEKV
jgi:GNAT superfamily N-acetyltransferase